MKTKEDRVVISAIITTCNRIELFKLALKSVLRQTYGNIEVIVVDDGSTDGTEEYCKKLSGIKYIRLTEFEHKNGSFTRNIGLKTAKGKYVAFLDDDDEWMPQKIEKQVQKISGRDNIGMVYTSAIIEFEDGSRQGDIVGAELRGYIPRAVFYNNVTSTSTMLFDRRKLLEVGGFDENLNYWQDTELVIRICQKYEIDYVKEPLTIYRENLNDKNRRSNNIDGYKDAIDYINEKYKNEIELLSEKEKKKRRAMLSLDMAVRLMKNGQDREAKRYLKEVFKNEPSFKSFLKYLFNYTWVKKMRK
ncbi:glycosyltransferase family 2 protein [Candidatus Saccharibacteria bacterium]|nr:glycosyltransferase family 2 protein [Candidatus Saccharibacteria bacterium]